jgi:hypothetical protein
MDLLYIALAAIAGGVVAATIGWLDSKKPFAPRKFGSSLLRAAVAGGVFAIGYNFAGPVGISDILIAGVAGAGVDVLGNRAVGAIKRDHQK